MKHLVLSIAIAVLSLAGPATASAQLLFTVPKVEQPYPSYGIARMHLDPQLPQPLIMTPLAPERLARSQMNFSNILGNEPGKKQELRPKPSFAYAPMEGYAPRSGNSPSAAVRPVAATFGARGQPTRRQPLGW